MKTLFDVIIIGAGPIGIHCGIVCQKKGLRILILEKNCLLHSIYKYPRKMRFFSSTDLLELENIPFISEDTKPNRDEALAYYRRLALMHHLPIQLFEEVKSVLPQNGGYSVQSTKAAYFTHHVIVATGFFDIPNSLNVPGEDLPKVHHYFDDAHYYSGQHVAVVGASNSAVDAALACFRAGASVSMIVRGKSIGNRVKYWVKPDIENRIIEGNIKAYFLSEIIAIEKEAIHVQQNKKIFQIPNHFVLAMTGYRPDFNFLSNMGIQFSEDSAKIPVHHAATMETNMPGIYLAGVVCGGMETHKWFIENSRNHAEKIAAHICANQL